MSIRAQDRQAAASPRINDDPQHEAAQAGLVYVSDDQPGITREPFRGRFRYRDAAGRVIKDARILARIAALAIPPAYDGVWICARSDGHVQATGRDARGRKQYRYHPRFRELRESTKFHHMLEFARALPPIRQRIAKDLARRGLPREKVLAAVVRLLEATMIRVGNPGYASQNKSYGLTTLRNRHVAVDGAELRFNFRGKSGRQWKLQLHDRRIARIVKASQDLPGQHLFQYIDGDGLPCEVTSGDINAYLKAISGAEITAKDFRTWHGTVLAAVALAEGEVAMSDAAAKRNVRAAIERVAARLGNTPTICRKCYVHPEILACYREGRLDLGNGPGRGGLEPDEAAVLDLLERRLGRSPPRGEDARRDRMRPRTILATAGS